MHFINLRVALLLMMPCFLSPIRAQNDSLPAVLTILPAGNVTCIPVFSAFCNEQVWLCQQAFDIPTRRFLSADSAFSCLPASVIHQFYGYGSAHASLWWKPDPYDSQYYWLDEYQHDTLVIWRYDLQKAQQERFVAQYQGNEYLVGKAGIWVTHNQELTLWDRHSGQVLNRKGKPDSTARYSLGLRNWGDDVLVSDRQIFQPAQNRYVPFFPLPPDMEGCKSPEKMQFQAEVCGSWYWENGEGHYAYFLSTPDHVPVRLPFGLVANGATIEKQILASNPPWTWFYFPGKLLAFDINTGDSLVYRGHTGEPLPGNQDGRFLGFSSELGLSFFDKARCEFRVLDLPYGDEKPRNFSCNQNDILLTYENHWEIVNCLMLDTAFRRSVTEEEFQVFEKERNALYQRESEDFYQQYAAYLKLYNRYRHSKNPKIADGWDYAKAGIRQALYSAADSLLENIAVDYAAGRYDPSISCELAQALFNYYGYRGELQKARQLLSMDNHSTCISEHLQYGDFLIELVNTTQYRLDSLQKGKQAEDQRLYALGKLWWDYCFQKRAFRYSFDPRGDFDQSHNYYRQLLRQYPQSRWADNAAYDTLYYIDYHAHTTDDDIPDGSDPQAFTVFTQFLKDYPHSDRRPDVLLRLAGIVQRGLQGRYNNQSGQGQLAAYLDTIAQDYPAFASASEDYRKLAAGLKTQTWSSRWKLLVHTDQAVYKATDTILVNIQFYNQSGMEQTLDTTFLNHWQDRLFLHLYQSGNPGCEDRSGDFSLTRQNAVKDIQPVTVPAGQSYAATFTLGHTSQIKTYGSKIFDLSSGGTYGHYMEYHHPVLTWLHMPAVEGGRFSLE